MAPSIEEVFSISCILALPFLYETSKSFRYYFKFFCYYAMVMVIAVFVIPVMAVRARDVKNLLKQCRECCLHQTPRPKKVEVPQKVRPRPAYMIL